MASTAISAQGTVVSISPDGTTWTPVKNIKTFSGFDGSAAEIDVTNLDSLAKEFRLGLKDSGNFTLEIDRDFADPGQIALIAAQVAASEQHFKVAFANTAKNTAIFKGFVKKFGMNGGVDNVVKSSVDIRINGAVTLAGPSGNAPEKNPNSAAI